MVEVKNTNTENPEQCENRCHYLISPSSLHQPAVEPSAGSEIEEVKIAAER